MPTLRRRVVYEWSQLCFQLAVPTHFRLNLLIQIYSALVDADRWRARAVRQASAALWIANGSGWLEGTLASVLLVHEARVRGIGQGLYISQVYVLFVVSARDSVVVSFLSRRLGLLRLDELLRVVDGPHDVVVARLLHHLRHLHVTHSLQLAVRAAVLVAAVYPRQVVVRWPFRAWRLLLMIVWRVGVCNSDFGL